MHTYNILLSSSQDSQSQSCCAATNLLLLQMVDLQWPLFDEFSVDHVFRKAMEQKIEYNVVSFCRMY